jgi:NADPH:quinone reductase-like Zn-dependent oxidoreductase
MQKQFHAALEQNTIHPVIDRTFNFDQVKEAYQYLQSGRHFGKIVIRLD